MNRTKQRVCPNCGWIFSAEGRMGEREHCPNCLSGIHKEDREGCECGGILEPVGIWVKADEKWEIIQRCNFCGEMQTSPMEENDSIIKALSIASKPLSQPPFPIERLEELTRMMGGSGRTGGDKNEPRK